VVSEPEPPAPEETLSYKDLPSDLTNTLDKVVYQLSLLSKTVSALETRLSKSEDKMTSVIDELRQVDTSGQDRVFSTSEVIETSTLIKEMPAEVITQNLEAEALKREEVEVNPGDRVDETFMRQTNRFVQV